MLKVLQVFKAFKIKLAEKNLILKINIYELVYKDVFITYLTDWAAQQTTRHSFYHDTTVRHIQEKSLYQSV